MAATTLQSKNKSSHTVGARVEGHDKANVEGGKQQG